MDKNKVVLGLSGGIDSAAACLLLLDKGFDVHALYFSICGDDEDAYERASDFCVKSGVSLAHRDVSEKFKKYIITDFCNEYMNGHTPMPCIRCNPMIKWQVLKDYADEIDAFYIATGHYASVSDEDGMKYINRSECKKDQSYMLCGLDQSILSRALLPLSCFSDKNAVREYVRSKGLEFPVNIKESQDICFVKTNYREFLIQSGCKAKAGNFIDEKGNIIGRHNSYFDYTIGQGRGLGMGFNKKVYVKEINPDTGDVVLCDDSDLYQKNVNIRISSFAEYGSIDYIPDEYINSFFDVKIRYGAIPAKARLVPSYGNTGLAVLEFDIAQRAPAPGQYAVFYDKNRVIGCGIIY